MSKPCRLKISMAALLSVHTLPFNSFTDFWDDATGEPIHTCADNKNYCPDAKTLVNVGTMSFWAEGVEGDIHLEIDSVRGYNCK